MSTLTLQTPRAFLPLLGPARYKGAHGGRGSGKSHFFAERLVEECVTDPTTRAVCIREVQKDLKQSSKQLIEDKISALGVQDYFDILDTEIHVLDDDGKRCGLIIFQGMQNHTADSIKSLEGFRIAWVEEAQSLSQRSLDLLTPTLRLPGSEIWFSWNPKKADDPVDAFMRSPDAVDDPDIICVEVNFRDNPWFHQTALVKDMERDRRRDPDKYAHIWLGAYQRRSEAAVFKHWREEEFDVPAGLRPYYGADWGFSVDPTVLVRCFVDEANRILYVDAEAYAVGCEIDDTPALFAGDCPAGKLGEDGKPLWRNDRKRPGVPGAYEWPIRADSARPETISYMRKRGFKITAAKKGAGSVEEGVTFLQNYDIVVRPACTHTSDELATYSYKVDKRTDEVLPELEDKKNHVIDALRYAVEDIRRTPGRVIVSSYG
ncbi:MAG TPA: PBSX family phage terminase large subunit [Caulobacteraceae bacterium]|nr:PBSX family phage terminase large subunit [Caulobacteraceae bacterium]